MLNAHEAHQIIATGIGHEPWRVTRQQIADALEALNLDSGQENFVWESRYFQEAQAVGTGKWPADVPQPENVDPWVD
jgi:hypothetical protein